MNIGILADFGNFFVHIIIAISMTKNVQKSTSQKIRETIFPRKRVLGQNERENLWFVIHFLSSHIFYLSGSNDDLNK